MSGVALDPSMADSLSAIVHQKIIELGWNQEDDTSLAEYIVLMLVNGKTQDQIQSELANDLIPDVEGIPEFTHWLLQQVEIIRGGSALSQNQSSFVQQEAATSAQESGEQSAAFGMDEIPAAYDADMGDAAPDNAPRGPKGLHGGRPTGRGGRMIGQMSKAMDRAGEAALHRVGGQSGTGRINSHSRGVPRGPKHISNRDIKPGMQKALNGLASTSPQPAPTPMMQNGQPGQPGQPMMSMSPQQQMEFMAMMEQQARMMAQFMPGMVQPGMNQGFQQNGSPQQNANGRSMFDRVESGRGRGGRGRGRGGFQNGPGRTTTGHQNTTFGDNTTENEVKTEETPSSTMDVEQASQTLKPGDPKATMCRFNLVCINKDCPYVHQSPAAPPGVPVDMAETCTFGVACKNARCVAKHPSPALKKAHQAEEICKFFPNCTNPMCGFKHPTARLCRNGGDCKVEGCPFTHLQTPCRFKPCYNANCPYKHEEGQKGGAAAGHVWTKDQPQHVSERKFVSTEEEELVKPEAEQEGQEVNMPAEDAALKVEGVVT